MPDTPDRPGLPETLARAYRSTDLRHKASRCDADVLQAAGMVACSVPAFTALARIKYALDPTAFPAAIEALSGVAWHMDRHGRWRSTRAERTTLANVVLRYWVAPGCRVCTGRRFMKLPDAPALGTRACPACMGSGDIGLRLPKSLPAATWYARALDLLAWLQRQESEAASKLARKLSNGPRLVSRP
jgi:hypothetical protein